MKHNPSRVYKPALVKVEEDKILLNANLFENYIMAIINNDVVAKLREEALYIYKKSREEPVERLKFAYDETIDKDLRDIKNKPYLFVLGCVMDRQVKAEVAWSIPHKVCAEFKADSFEKLKAIPEDKIVKFFKKDNIHRFDETMGQNFYAAVQRISTHYNGDASLIWADKPSSATVVYRFLCFKGVGIKIATMAANILSRCFKVEFSDMSAIDVSPDVQVCRILYRMGLTESEDRTAAIYKAKEINPPFPGLIDLVCWDYGRNYCHPSKPECQKCPFNNVCSKQGIN